MNDTKSTSLVAHDYAAINYIDSFINVHDSSIKKNTALREHYEGLCTKLMLPLIDKKGYYDDLPFELVVTTSHEGVAYGNFIYDDDKHFVKVTCIINKSQLEELQEKKEYYIKFKIAKFEDGVTFDNEFSKIELPTVNAYLKYFRSIP